ncbi:MAG: polyphosphate polymerase domain-containing protein [Lachnospiraceae bacterium]|nr:polyphosphate polymerase domain-containing protein [Lachnospiraceae bacterium]
MEMRHELKYVITPVQYIMLRSRLKPIMQLDEHSREDGNYFIRSIYFDSYQYDALNNKNNGVWKRKKYRLRFYNGDARECLLECKIKEGDRIEKISSPITRAEAEELLETKAGSIMYSSDSLMGEMKILMKNRGFKPVVLVDYLREAYVYPVSTLRITFDMEIAAGTVKDCLKKERCFSNILPYGQMILEVKYDQYIPEHISHIISSIQPVQRAASKYAMCVTEKLEGRII